MVGRALAAGERHPGAAEPLYRVRLGPRKVVQSVRRVTQLPAAAAHTPRLGLKRTPFCGSGRPDFRATVYVRSPFRLDRAS